MKTQANQILEYLQEGNALTQIEALNKFGCARLAARICELRERGIDIETKQVAVKRAHGGKAMVAQYRLSHPDCI